MKANTDLAKSIHTFLADYLAIQRGFSRHTILSYRDTIKLLLSFAARRNKTGICKLTLSDLSPAVVSEFLEYLEAERGNSRQTRNVRLACLHSLFRHIATREPVLFDQCQRILGIPFKRTPTSTTIDYLEPYELKAVLEAVDRSTPDGYRDYTLLFFMHQTGARVQELIGVSVGALQLDRPQHVRFMGKGAKERLCPLWPETVTLLRSLLKQRTSSPSADALVFLNHRGERLSRHGVRYLLAKYVQIASRDCPSLRNKRIHPHSVRHSTAVHMLQSGIDINTIRGWLGHVHQKTTNRYAEVNLEMKRDALNKHLPVTKATRRWKANNRLLEWLESL
jgi:site-specific recombinase XerD